LSVTYTARDDGRSNDVVCAQNVWLYVPAGKAPTSFLSGGGFSAVWDGWISPERRGNFRFQGELNGGLKIEINGQVILEAETNGTTSLTQPVLLKSNSKVRQPATLSCA
jgi:hypothetical protein